MKKRRLTVCFVFVSIGVLAASAADWNWKGEIMPGAVLANFDADDFDMRGMGEEEEMSLVSMLPVVSLGTGIDTAPGIVDLQAGAGWLFNNRLRSYILQAEAGFLFEARRSVMVGPHLGVWYYGDPEWWGDGDVEFSDSWGCLLGLKMTMGDRISYVLAADYYISVDDIEVEYVGPGWRASDDHIDMSGFAVKFGLQGLF